MTKPVEEVVVLKLPQAKAKVKQTAEESNGNGVKGGVRSISKVFSRILSTPSATSALPKQELVDAKRHLYLTPRSTANRNRNRVQVFSLESADGVVITSTRNVEDENFSQTQVQSADGVVITPDRKVNELRDQDGMVEKSNSTPLTILSHEDNDYCDALHRSQLRKDALLLASAKQAVPPPRAKGSDSIRNTSTPGPGTLIIDVDKNTTVTNKEPDLFEQGNVGASIFHRIGVAVDACSMRLCFERDEDEDKFIIVIPHGFCVDANDDVSTISGGLNE